MTCQVILVAVVAPQSALVVIFTFLLLFCSQGPRSIAAAEEVALSHEKILELDRLYPYESHAHAFRHVGQEYTNSDKFTRHHYEYIYGKYLAHPHLFKAGLKVLEIGLGCTMNYGPGESVKLWKTWFKDVQDFDLHFMEYDKECVEKWANHENMKDLTIHIGDQNNTVDLENIFLKANITKPTEGAFRNNGFGQFDIIVDDGGHYFDQIRTSFEVLFKDALAPGGLYVIEDVCFSPGSKNQQFCDGKAITWLQGMMATVIGDAGLTKPHPEYSSDPLNLHAIQARWVLGVDVQKNIAAITKANEYMCFELDQAWCPDRI